MSQGRDESVSWREGLAHLRADGRPWALLLAAVVLLLAPPAPARAALKKGMWGTGRK